MSITINKPSIKRTDMDSVLTCMVSDHIGPGTLSDRLVKDVCEYLGIDGGIALREYHRSIKIALRAAGLERGKRVVLSPLCPAAYLEVLREMEVEPFFVDVEADTGCLSASQLDRLEGEEIGAIIAYSNLGFAPDLEALAEFGVPIIEDISQGLGGNTGKGSLGSYGAFVILSLEPEGIVTSGGGVLVLGHGKKETSLLKKLVEGYNAELLLPDFNAALGITQIKSVEKFIERRKEIAQIYVRAVMQSRHKTLAQKGEGENVFFSFPVLLDSGMKDVQAYARKKGIDTVPAYLRTILGILPEEEKKWPIANSLFLRCLLFPLYPTLSKTSIQQIEKVLTTLP